MASAASAQLMQCPVCRSDQTGVVMTRRLLDADGGGTLRRHACSCRCRWWTLQPPPAVVDPWRVRWVNDVPKVLPKTQA